MDKKLSIGQKIWHEAKKQRFTKLAFAAALGISRQTLDNWIHGIHPPGADDLSKVSEILGIIIATDGSITPSGKGALVFQDGYIGMHERVWGTLEKVMDRDGLTITFLSETINNLTKDKPVTS